MSGAVLLDRHIQSVQIVPCRCLDLLPLEAVLVGIGLEMRAVGIEYVAAHQTLYHGLLDHRIENLLVNRAVGETAAPVLTDRRGVGYLVGQAQAEKPAVGDVDLNLTYQLALASNTEQVTDKQRLEEQYGVKRGPAVIGTVEMTHSIADKAEIERSLDLTQQMVRWHEFFERYHLKLVLIWGRVFKGACVLQSCMAPLLNRGVPRWLSLLIVLVVLCGGLGFMSWGFGAQIAAEMESLTTMLPEAWEQLRERLEDSQLAPLIDNAVENASIMQGGVSQVGMIVVSMGGSIINLFVLIVGMVYFAAQPDLYRRGLLLLAPVKSRPRLGEALDASGKALRYWLGGQVVAMTVTGVLVGISMWLLGVPAPLGLGLVAGLLDFVPLVGPIAAAIPALLLAYTVSPETALFVLMAYVIIQQIEGNILQPLVQQRAVSLPPALLLFALLASSTLFGLPGVILAAPLAVVLFVMVNRLYVAHEDDDKKSRNSSLAL